MHDVIILGGGPAGLTAALYSARAGLDTLIIEKGQVGGQISTTLAVDNYPGLLDAQGPDMSEVMLEQAEAFGAKRIVDEIVSIELEGDTKVLKSSKETYKSKALIYATGANPRKLQIPGEAEYTGKGVGYCATCDGAFYQGSDIYVVGGGDSAVEESIFLSKFGKRVIILYRGEKLKAAQSIQDKAKTIPNIEVRYNEEVKEVMGEMFATKLRVVNNKTGEEKIYTAEEGDPDIGLFIFAGYIPNTQLVDGLLDLEYSYIKAGEDTKTNIPGIFAAGDVRTKTVRQVVTATADGAVAALAADKYIQNLS